jgi:hypothetical protein
MRFGFEMQDLVVECATRIILRGGATLSFVSGLEFGYVPKARFM